MNQDNERPNGYYWTSPNGYPEPVLALYLDGYWYFMVVGDDDVILHRLKDFEVANSPIIGPVTLTDCNASLTQKRYQLQDQLKVNIDQLRFIALTKWAIAITGVNLIIICAQLIHLLKK
jgi:hypothetical protein